MTQITRPCFSNPNQQMPKKIRDKLFSKVARITLDLSNIKYVYVTSDSKKPGQTTVVIQCCSLSRFFWIRRYDKNSNGKYHWNAFGWKIKQNNPTSDMIPSHYALSLHGVISVLQLHTTLSKNHYNIFKFDSQKWYLLERSKSTYCTSGLNSRPRVMYYPFHMLKQGLLKIWTEHSLKLQKMKCRVRLHPRAEYFFCIGN